MRYYARYNFSKLLPSKNFIQFIDSKFYKTVNNKFNYRLIIILIKVQSILWNENFIP